MSVRDNLRAIETVLHSLGLFGNSLAVRQTIWAVELAHEDQELLINIMKGLYPAVAERFQGATVQSVERNLRSARDRQWAKGDVELLRKMAGYHLSVKPTTGEFVDIIRYYMEVEGLLPDHWQDPKKIDEDS